MTQTRDGFIDSGFLKRVYYTTLWVSGIVFLILCTVQNAILLLNYTVGVFFGISFVKVTEILVLQLMQVPREVQKHRWVSIVLTVGKYAALIGTLYALTRYDLLHPLGFLIGWLMIQIVLILKLIGRALLKRMGLLNTAHQALSNNGSNVPSEVDVE